MLTPVERLIVEKLRCSDKINISFRCADGSYLDFNTNIILAGANGERLRHDLFLAVQHYLNNGGCAPRRNKSLQSQ